MRTILTICLLALAVPVFAGDDWPEKGDVVYVSAELKTSMTAISVTTFGIQNEITIEPCEPLTANGYKAGKKLWFEDRAGRLFKLKGNWSEHIHADKNDCDKHYKERGQPLVQGTSYNFKLIDKSHD